MRSTHSHSLHLAFRASTQGRSTSTTYSFPRSMPAAWLTSPPPGGGRSASRMAIPSTTSPKGVAHTSRRSMKPLSFRLTKSCEVREWGCHPAKPIVPRRLAKLRPVTSLNVKTFSGCAFCVQIIVSQRGGGEGGCSCRTHKSHKSHSQRSNACLPNVRGQFAKSVFKSDVPGNVSESVLKETSFLGSERRKDLPIVPAIYSYRKGSSLIGTWRWSQSEEGTAGIPN